MLPDFQLLLICLLFGCINLIGSLAYAARIAGVRTRRIATGFALFNILVLVSRLSNSLLGPLLAKRIETNIGTHNAEALAGDFRTILISAMIGAAAGMIAVPSAQRVIARSIDHLSHGRSVMQLLGRSISLRGWNVVRTSLVLPARTHFKLSGLSSIGWRVLVANMAAQALLTVGVLASLYAGALDPSFRLTSSQLSSAINAGAVILMVVFIDPYISMVTDDVMEGRISDAQFRRTIVWISFSRIAGMMLSQFLLIPTAAGIVIIANLI